MTKQEIHQSAIHRARIELARAQQRLAWCAYDDMKKAAKEVYRARKKLDRLESEVSV